MDEREDWHLTEALHHEQGRGDPFAAAVRATRMAMVITDPNLPDNPIVFASEGKTTPNYTDSSAEHWQSFNAPPNMACLTAWAATVGFCRGRRRID